MTVREIMKTLEQLPPDLAVMVNVPEYDEIVPVCSMIFQTPDYVELRVFKPEE